MKINKACDLSSISVLPPQSRRRSGISSSVPEMSSTFRHNQGPSQQQQQRSQQSLSQGFSSQHHAIFSQFSQNSQDETLTNDQLVVSQERESSLKRFSSLPPVNHTREEGQMPLSRSSTGLIRKWGSAISEQRCQMGEEFEHRIGTIESSLSRFGLMLESLQTDIMQVNKGTKELAMDMESIRQKLIANDNTFQMINKGQEDLKSSLHGDLKLISDQLNQDRCNKNSQDISILLSSLQEKIGVFISNLRNDLSKSFTNEMQAIACKLKALDQKNPSPTVLLPKAVSYCANPLGKAPKMYALYSISLFSQLSLQFVAHYWLFKDQLIYLCGIRVVPPKIEMGTWNSVKREHVTLTNRDYSKGHKHNKVSQTGLDFLIMI
ncbi:hypothetical protein Ccrd_000653 [Cynara cardunculus var. scolymus]|uniref:Protein PAIR1 n=1 Tax=Cynara cardunculus var. scolymus TaxID=59895 RepID=A0A103XUN9_CYNCS|nr:hypothetical protein Ccrd_000653 [Cynara cardunculus var. scolymus]